MRVLLAVAALALPASAALAPKAVRLGLPPSAVPAAKPVVSAPAIRYGLAAVDALSAATIALQDAGQERSLLRASTSLKDKYGFAGLPKALMLGVLSIRGKNSVLFEGELDVDGVPTRVGLKAPTLERQKPRALLEAFQKEVETTSRMVDVLPKGWAAKTYGAVDAGGSPALAFELVKGKDIDALTPAETLLLSDARIEEAMAGLELLRRAGLAGLDSPQLMMLTEDQLVNGVARSRGDLVFIDAANSVAEDAQSPQDFASQILVVKAMGARFAAEHPDAPVGTLLHKLPVRELSGFLETARKPAYALPTPDPSRFLVR